MIRFLSHQRFTCVRCVPAFLLSTFISCSQPATLTQQENAVIEREVSNRFEQYYEDVKNYGLLAERSYLDSSTAFFWVPPGYSEALTYDSVLTILTQNASRFTSVINAMDTLRIIPLTKELATYTARLQSIIKDTTGRSDTFHLVESGVVIKRKDGWKLLSGQTSLVQ
ncbi:MAG: hypothetical protein JST81_15585 [Bacteroidetes bacterium]|nr:hypothetical protein [Bacteroidota bacterium]